MKNTHPRKDPPVAELKRIATTLKNGGWTQREVEKEFKKYKNEIKKFVKKIYNKP